MLRERRRHANFKPNRKLDRKSSRGMIYENEELRLRTININAEVERGQSDIKKLRRENYQLRKEIWNLRDEYDRLGKLLKTNKSHSIDDSTNGSHSSFPGHCRHGCDNDDAYQYCSCLLDDDSVSCDMCTENEHYMKDFDVRTLVKAINGDRGNNSHIGHESNTPSKSNACMPKPIRSEKMDMSFDHLSVVSEECLSNSDDQTNNQQDDKSKNENNDVSNLNPESPYANFQSTIPPLKHFENLCYKDIGPNIDASGDIIHFNGEMYQTTPPPPTPPPSIPIPKSSLPLPPPPTLSEKESIDSEKQLENGAISMEKPTLKYFFAPLKSKSKSAANATDTKTERRPDVFVNNILPSEGNRLATIRKPHNVLKCPSNPNATNVDQKATDQLDAILHDIQGLSKGIENMQMHKNQIYENVESAKNSDSDQSHPYRTEMSLILSYNGNKSKYTSTKNASNSLESDVETPPPNVPHAMKLLPNKLPYAIKSELFKPSQLSEQGNVNIENSANEEILSKSQVSPSCVNNTVPNDDSSKNGRTSLVEPNNEKHSENQEVASNGDKTSSSKENQPLTNSKANEKQKINEIDEKVKANGTQENMKDHKSRRVSIQFNGKPMTEQQETEPHSNDYDMTNINDLSAEEVLSITPISCRRSRRSSCSRKLSDDSIGSFLYPPNPFSFGSHKRGGRRPSFLSRRHSDGLLPAHQNQYHIDYGLSTKPSGRHHCHRNHIYNNHLIPSDNGNMGSNSVNNNGGSTATSICNSMASSRESLASIGLQSTSRRKISITSHSKNGGKIPWCACWGNGCI